MIISASELAALVGGRVEGNPDLPVTGVATVDDATDGDVVLAEDARYLLRAASSAAGCIIVKPVLVGNQCGKTLICHDDPAAAFAEVLDIFGGEVLLPPPGIGPGTVVEPGARVGSGVSIGPNCFVGAGAVLGDGCVLHSNISIGRGARVGSATLMHPGVTVYPGCTIGSGVILHAGVVIGADGFGYRPGPAGLTRVRHIGTVRIGDNVEIGANSTVDRAKTGATIVGKGTKIDNLVHIAHNVRIGEHCVIVALSGIAGSVEIGSGVTLAAQTGVKDHVRIGDGCTVAARAGVIGDLAAGSVVSGFPARDHLMEKRVEAARLRLPDALARLRALERMVAKLSAEGGIGEDDNTADRQ